MPDNGDPLELARRIAEDLADDGPTTRVRRQGRRLLNAISALENEFQEGDDAPSAPNRSSI